MFTGLVETIGTLTDVRYGGMSVELRVRADADGYDVMVGGSVAVDGVCLTAEKIDDGGSMYFSAVSETLRRTSLDNAAVGRRVNLERAMRVDGRLDGHIVLGHVDAVGRIVHDERAGAALVRAIEIPDELTPFMAEKGSVCVDGISLTIAKVGGRVISVSFIPATLKNTTMSMKRAGDAVNIECDVLARYIHRIITAGAPPDKSLTGESLIDKMNRYGFS